MYLTKMPKLIQNLFPNFVWSVPTTEKVLYLTFDDGPMPEVTPRVLEILASYDAKATFFCVGDNVSKHPGLLAKVLAGGHAVGNHTYHHLNGWETDNLPYFHNIRQCARLVQSGLFRPPYGRMSPKQAQFLTRHYKVIMWDVLSGDFDPNLSKEDCLANVLNGAKRGSIVVFHDSIKAQEKALYALPLVLEHFRAKGYRFESLKSLYDPKRKVMTDHQNVVSNPTFAFSL